MRVPVEMQHSPEAEASWLAAILLRPVRALELAPLVPEEFYDPRHAETAAAIARVLARGGAVDPITVADELGGKLASVGGLSWLSDLADSCGTAENAAHYARIVADHALRRRVIAAAEDVLSAAAQDVNSGEDCYAEIVRQASNLQGPAGETDGLTLVQVADVTFKRLDDLANGRSKPSGVPTGYRDLDALTGGVARGAVTILAGRPSQGKSALARRIALNAAMSKMGAHVFSLEDPRDRYGDRTLADLAKIDLARFRADPTTGKLGFTKGDLDQLRWARDEVRRIGFTRLDDSAALSAAQIQNRVRRSKKELQTAIVVIDYVQLMRERGARDKREEVDRAGEALVKLARDEGVAVLLLSQLSRDSEKRDDKKPQLSDLRESGTLEQIADAVLMVHQAWRYLDPKSTNAKVREAYDQEAGTGQVLVRKNKHGACGEIRLMWDAPCATYRDMDRRHGGGGDDWRDTYQ